MIYIKDNTIKRISNWKDETIHILTDFDRTLTTGNSTSSWNVLSKNPKVPTEYFIEQKSLYNYYRPIEIDETISHEEKNKMMSEWWNKHISLLEKYKIKESVFKDAIKDKNIIEFRTGAKEFLENMYQRNIPVIIVSAGIGNYIEEFLKNNDANFSNIHIVSNFFEFEEGYVKGVRGNIVHSLNKNEASVPAKIQQLIKDRNNIILLGDIIPDINMAEEQERQNALKIGFLDHSIEENLELFKEHFDIVGTHNTTYQELVEKIEILKEENK